MYIPVFLDVMQYRQKRTDVSEKRYDAKLRSLTMFWLPYSQGNTPSYVSEVLYEFFYRFCR